MKLVRNLFLFSALVLFTATQATAQTSASEKMWKTLAKVTFVKQYDDLMGFKVDVPIFSKDVKKLNGKEMTITGYIVPVENYKSQKEFVFSAYPYNMCYFCGGAGPESVMEVVAKTPIKFTAEKVTIKGTFYYNDGDINKLMYMLKDVVLVE